MTIIELLGKSASEGNVPTAFVTGFTDGQAARAGKGSLTAYVRVGIDDYARGFRAGFFTRSGVRAPTAESMRRQTAQLKSMP